MSAETDGGVAGNGRLVEEDEEEEELEVLLFATVWVV